MTGASQHPSPHVPIERLDGNADLVVQGPLVLREDLEILQLLTGTVGIEPLTRARCDAYRLHEPTSLAGVPEACAAAGYDWALVPHARVWSRVRLVALDMDSTLITIECIDEMAALRGIGDEVAEVTAAAMRGEIDFRASLERRVALLAGMPLTDLARVYDERLEISPGAAELLDACHRIGAKTLLVSGGFTFFTDRLRQRLPIDYTLSNVLEIVDGQPDGADRAARSSMQRRRPRISAISLIDYAATTASRLPSATGRTTCRCWLARTFPSPIARSRACGRPPSMRSTIPASTRC